MKIVYFDQEMYAGWPANHGSWQWGNEWLCGFLRGKFVRESMHNIREPYDYCFARSYNEGETWSIESHGTEFGAGVVVHQAPEFSMQNSIRRVCGVYDHGGDDTDEKGGFFLSEDHGHNWHGPYLFSGLEWQFDGIEWSNTSRQAELPARNLMFLSHAKRHHWGTDRIFVVRHDGKEFHFVSYVDDGDGRAVMPAVAEINGRIVCVARRRKSGINGGWIDGYISDDGGNTWKSTGRVGDTGKSNGNPPALIATEQGLWCAYGNRTKGEIRAIFSPDGERWSGEIVLAKGSKHKSGYYDLGYPRLLRKTDGSITSIFYIATRERQQHIAMEGVA